VISGRGTAASRPTREAGKAAGEAESRGRERALEADANRRMIGMMDETAWRVDRRAAD
jgi:hypothetical protein